METKELKITIPEGFEIDKEKSTFEKIIFKKKEISLPLTWDEYVKQNPDLKVWRISANDIPYDSTLAGIGLGCESNTKTYLSKEEAEAFIALRKLLHMRNAWLKIKYPHWVPVFNALTQIPTIKFNGYKNKPEVCYSFGVVSCLSFPCKEMAEKFAIVFHDWLIAAKGLY